MQANFPSNYPPLQYTTEAHSDPDELERQQIESTHPELIRLLGKYDSCNTIYIFTKHFFQEFGRLEQPHFTHDMDLMYGSFEKQLQQLVEHLCSDDMTDDVKELALKQLPDTLSCDQFKLVGINKTLMILKSGQLEKAKLLLKIRDRECKALYKATAITERNKDIKGGSEEDWEVINNENSARQIVSQQELVPYLKSVNATKSLLINEQLTPSYLIAMQASRLSCCLLNAKSKDLIVAHCDIKESISQSAFYQVQQQLDDICKKYHSPHNKQTYEQCHSELITLLKPLISKHLYPQPNVIEIPTKDGQATCCLMTNKTVKMRTGNNIRDFTLSDLKAIELDVLHPHIRNELLECLLSEPFACEPSTAIDVFFVLGLNNAEFKDEIMYKYNFKGMYLEFIAKRFSDDLLEQWGSEQNKITFLKQLYPYLKETQQKALCISTLQTQNMSGMLNKDQLLLELNSLCELKGCDTSIKAIKVTLSLLGKSKTAPTFYLKSLYTAARSDNGQALELLYQIKGIHGAIRGYIIKNSTYVYPEHQAIRSGNLCALQTILKNTDRDLMYRDNGGIGVLIIAAAKHENSECLEYLLSQPHIDLGLIHRPRFRFIEWLTYNACKHNAIKVVTHHSFPFRLDEALRYLRIRYGQLDYNDIIKAYNESKAKLYKNMTDTELEALTLREKRTCLCKSIEKGDHKLVSRLLKYVSIAKLLNPKCQESVCGSFVRCKNDHIEVLKAMEEEGYKPEAATPSMLLYLIQYQKDIGLVIHLIQRYNTVGLKRSLTQIKTCTGLSLMHFAVLWGDESIIQALVNANAKLMSTKVGPFPANEYDKEDFKRYEKQFHTSLNDTPLQVYVKQKDIDIKVLTLILQHSGAALFDISTTGKKRKDPFLIVLENKKLEAVRCFINHYKTIDDDKIRESLAKAQKYVNSLYRIRQVNRELQQLFNEEFAENTKNHSANIDTEKTKNHSAHSANIDTEITTEKDRDEDIL